MISPSSNGSPHSGQNFGGCAGSSGSQPHLSHRYWGTPAGLGLPHSEQNFPLLIAPQLHTQPASTGTGRGWPQRRTEFSNISRSDRRNSSMYPQLRRMPGRHCPAFRHCLPRASVRRLPWSRAALHWQTGRLPSGPAGSPGPSDTVPAAFVPPVCPAIPIPINAIAGTCAGVGSSRFHGLRLGSGQHTCRPGRIGVSHLPLHFLDDLLILFVCLLPKIRRKRRSPVPGHPAIWPTAPHSAHWRSLSYVPEEKNSGCPSH